MKGFLLLLSAGILFVLLQSSILPLFFPISWRPNLILIIVLYLGLNADLSKALFAGLFLGALQDSFCGSSIGLYVSVYLIVVLVMQLLSEQLNVESSPMLLLLVAAGTLFQNVLVGFYLTVFAATAPVLHILLADIPQQLIMNILSAAILLFLLFRTQRIFGFHSSLSGLMSQSKHHGS